MKDTTAGYNNWIKSLDLKKKDIVNILPQCKESLFTGQSQGIIEKIKLLNKVLIELKSITEPSTPEWVTVLIKENDKLLNNPTSPTIRQNLFTVYKEYELQIANHDWTIGGIDSDFDFEKIYKKYKRETNINELFNELIKILEDILNDNNLDDKDNKVKILLAVVRNNQNKSCYADEGIITALYTFLIESACVLLKITSIAPLIISLIELLKKLISSFNDVKTKTNNEIKQITNLELKPAQIYNESGAIKKLEETSGIHINETV